MVDLGDPQEEINDGGLGFEVVTGLGVGNEPTNPIIDHGVGLKVGNNFGVSITSTDKGGDI